MVNGTKAAIDKFCKLYPRYTLKRTTINTWKTKTSKNKGSTSPLSKKSGRPNYLSDSLMKKAKDIIL